MNESDLEDAIAKSLLREINLEIMIKIHEASGWTLVALDESLLDADPHLMQPWIRENIRKEFKYYPPYRWMFKDKDDAALFSLRWK